MPIPLAPAIPWVLSALGGGALWEWVTGEDDEWADADVYNARMRDLHSGILQLNDLIARCKALHSNPELASWRAYVQNFGKFYSDVGKRFFDPPQSLIDETRRQASILAQWLDKYEQVCGSIPTGITEILPKPKPAETDTLKVALGVGTALGIVALLGAMYGRKGK